jgi:hypothetical protein
MMAIFIFVTRAGAQAPMFAHARPPSNSAKRARLDQKDVTIGPRLLWFFRSPGGTAASAGTPVAGMAGWRRPDAIYAEGLRTVAGAGPKGVFATSREPGNIGGLGWAPMFGRSEVGPP